MIGGEAQRPQDAARGDLRRTPRCIARRGPDAPVSGCFHLDAIGLDLVRVGGVGPLEEIGAILAAAVLLQHDLHLAGREGNALRAEEGAIGVQLPALELQALALTALNA